MVDHVLIDALTLESRDFAAKWKDAIRKAPQLKRYNALDDSRLIDEGAGIFPLLSRTLDRGFDRSLMGEFFVKMGKDRMAESFPVSEVIYSIDLAQKIFIEYVMTEFAPENPVRMYSSMGILTQAAEFFLLGCFYLTKGFLEATYTQMNSKDSVSEELLKKYFRDDFFFKIR
ncbi:hypothetical protein [Leadbettera azotonutricia]|uniref:RsbT co-antagonist protein RsbRD N-terminal domain-containing protein n=1 Tax=Leadbettera azotonutricia (strain ATCC BAA-888 / DSM 13862 / ZAS-9) TaxID=545695 RepID=F5YCF5_LEAAZ|nr:hypothetical protein [Leadbettera azotonutricia]AEF83097.1 hypothetical protein TREAZ_2855 [Leadbettera azotonutricia ZAS-9]